MKTIKKQIEITAPKEKVWAVLLEDAYTRNWYSLFSPGAYAKTDWIQDHKIIFKDNSGNGVIGTVAVKNPYEQITIEFSGLLKNGAEDYDSDKAKAIKGTKETYILSDVGDNTRLSIESDTDDNNFDEMSAVWELALKRIAELSHAI